MAGKRIISKNELVGDYRMLDRMSRDLVKHQKNVQIINRRIAKRVDADFKGGLVENLDIVMTHMRNAVKELENAKRELKRI